MRRKFEFDLSLSSFHRRWRPLTISGSPNRNHQIGKFGSTMLQSISHGYSM
ncbi:unnamed protein product [Arabidopsis halleri]